ncbi:MAG: DinB family protein [Bacteroidota bacterium]|nr:DinB family protein [Bacteroidota bacterium]
MITAITELFERDINKLVEEIKSYEDENALWKTAGHISNPAGNLVLHLIGNLNYFIGATLGNTGYIRDREKEFTIKNISKTKLVDDLEETRQVIKNTLANLPNEDLDKNFPVEIGGKTSSTQQILIHLLAHFNYHLGQVNYHRRMIDK